MSEKEIFREAEAHDGKYLLPRRFGRPSIPPDDRDLLYEACDRLVASGHASRIPSWSNMAPGIFLTGKPFDAA